jgi:hypothetical protein
MHLKALCDHLSEPKGYWRLFGKCPKKIGYLFRNAYRVEDTLWEMPQKMETQWEHFPLGLQPMRNKGTPQSNFHCVSIYFRHFLFISLKRGGFIKLKFDLETTIKFKSHQQFFSNFCSFQLYHFQPNSNWCDSPFNFFG